MSFPGIAADEAWPPAAFMFQASWLADPAIGFERGQGGEIVFVQRFGALRLLLDIDTAHTALDIAPRSRDFMLLRLMPSALRFTQRITHADPMPPPLLGGPMVPAAEHHLYAASSQVIGTLERAAGDAGSALVHALRRTPPGIDMFERAAARCIAEGGHALDQVARLARGLQRLATAHAEVLAAHALQPDYAAMERMVAAAARAQTRIGRWTGDLLAHALQQLDAIIARPRQMVEALHGEALREIDQQSNLLAAEAVVLRQARIRDRLMELAVFWQRCCAAWASVHAETADRRDLDALTRNALRRLQLRSLYDPDFGGSR